MVDAAVDRNESSEHSVRGDGDFAERARLQKSRWVSVGQRQGAGLDRRRYPGLGIAGNSGISGGKISAGTALANRKRSTGDGAYHIQRNACRLCAAAAAYSDEHVAAGQKARDDF